MPRCLPRHAGSSNLPQQSCQAPSECHSPWSPVRAELTAPCGGSGRQAAKRSLSLRAGAARGMSGGDGGGGRGKSVMDSIHEAILVRAPASVSGHVPGVYLCLVRNKARRRRRRQEFKSRSTFPQAHLAHLGPSSRPAGPRDDGRAGGGSRSGDCAYGGGGGRCEEGALVHVLLWLGLRHGIAFRQAIGEKKRGHEKGRLRSSRPLRRPDTDYPDLGRRICGPESARRQAAPHRSHCLSLSCPLFSYPLFACLSSLVLSSLILSPLVSLLMSSLVLSSLLSSPLL